MGRHKNSRNGYRQCNVCHEIKPNAAFKAANHGVTCWDCPRPAGHRDSGARAIYNMAYKLHRRYGLSTEQYSAMLVSQNGRCAICRSEEPLGNLRDSAEITARAVEYLAAWGAVTRLTVACRGGF